MLVRKWQDVGAAVAVRIGGFDCRNLLCVPLELVPTWRAKSISFNMALVSGAILETRSVSDLYILAASTIKKFNASSTYQHHFGPLHNPIQRASWAEGRYGRR